MSGRDPVAWARAEEAARKAREKAGPREMTAQERWIVETNEANKSAAATPLERDRTRQLAERYMRTYGYGAGAAPESEPEEVDAGEFKKVTTHEDKRRAAESAAETPEDWARKVKEKFSPPRYMTHPEEAVSLPEKSFPKEPSVKPGSAQAKAITDHPKLGRDKYYRTDFLQDLDAWRDVGPDYGGIDQDEWQRIYDDYQKEMGRETNVKAREYDILKHGDDVAQFQAKQAEHELGMQEQQVGQEVLINRQLQSDLRANDAQMQRARIHYEEEMRTHNEKLETAMANLERVGGSNVFGSEGAQIFAAIFMALTGKIGRNVMEPIINAKVAEQQNALSAAKGSVVARNAAIDGLMRQGLDERESIAAYRVALHEQVMLRLKEIDSKTQDQRLKFKIKTLGEQVELGRRDSWNQWALLNSQRAKMSADQRAAAWARAQAAGAPRKATAEAILRGEVPLSPREPEKFAADIQAIAHTGDRTGLYVGKDVAQRYHDSDRLSKQLVADIDQLQKITKNWNIDDHVQGQAIGARLAVNLRTYLNMGGRLNNELLNDIVIGPEAVSESSKNSWGALKGKFIASGGHKALENLKQAVKHQHHEVSQQTKGPPVVYGVVIDEKGNTRPGLSFLPMPASSIAEQKENAERAATIPSEQSLGVK